MGIRCNVTLKKQLLIRLLSKKVPLSSDIPNNRDVCHFRCTNLSDLLTSSLEKLRSGHYNHGHQILDNPGDAGNQKTLSSQIHSGLGHMQIDAAQPVHRSAGFYKEAARNLGLFGDSNRLFEPKVNPNTLGHHGHLWDRDNGSNHNAEGGTDSLRGLLLSSLKSLNRVQHDNERSPDKLGMDGTQSQFDDDSGHLQVDANLQSAYRRAANLFRRATSNPGPPRSDNLLFGSAALRLDDYLRVGDVGIREPDRPLEEQSSEYEPVIRRTYKDAKTQTDEILEETPVKEIEKSIAIDLMNHRQREESRLGEENIEDELSDQGKRYFIDASRFGTPSNENLKLCGNFVLSYDRRMKHPIWVLQHLTKGTMHIDQLVDRELSSFHHNETLHEHFRSSNEDYFNSGYERGHMCPAYNNRGNQEWMNQSFCLSNIAPQLRNLNRGPWRALENYVCHLARRSKNMYVVTGAAYKPQGKTMHHKVIGPNKVSVPTHFYKVWVRETKTRGLSMEAFLLPNSREVKKESLLSPYRIDIDKELASLEKITGLLFFDKVDRSKVDKPKSFQEKYMENKKQDL